MKKLLLGLALCLLPFIVARTQERQPPQKSAAQSESATPTPTPTPLQVIPEEVFDHELKDLDGRSFYLSNYRGQVFVINLWASWCGPCREMIPELNRIYKDYRGRGVEFVLLTTEDPKVSVEGVGAAVAEFKMKYKLGWLDSKTAERLMSGRPSIPQTFVVAADGRIVTRFFGYSERVPPMIRKGIEDALNPPPASGPRP